MLKENWRFIARVERVSDIVITIVAFFTAYYGRSSLKYWSDTLDLGLPFEGPALAPIDEYWVVLFLALIAYGLVLNLMGAYGSMRLCSSLQLLQTFFVSSFIVFIFLSAFLFLFKLDLSRSFVALFCVLMVLSLAAERYITIGVLRFWRRRGYNYRRLLICGVGEQAVRLTNEITKRPELGIRIRCFGDLHEPGSLSIDMLKRFRVDLRKAGCPQIGRLLQGPAEVGEALRKYAIDEVIFTDFVEVLPAVEDLVVVCAEQGVRTTIAADLFSIGMVKSGISYFGGMPLIHFQTPPGDRWELAVKRGIDIAGSALLMLLLLPVFLLLAAAIRLTSTGPVLFMQRRMGLNGRIFNLYKFRSMQVNAEGQLEQLRHCNEMQGPVFKMKNDPRVTPVGCFLRRFSLDELPQLWNVLRGDMSLVGPRPPVPGEVNAYSRRDRRRLSMRPGITCIWQVSGRNEIKDFDSWVSLDLDYIDNWSLGLDLRLLFRTIPAVLFGTGAR